MRWVTFGDDNFESYKQAATGCVLPVLVAAWICLVFWCTGAFGPGPEKAPPLPTPPAKSSPPAGGR